MSTLESPQAKIQKLHAQAEALTAKTSRVVIEKIRGLIAEHGLTAADIDAHTGGKQSAKPATSVAKYRDPKSGAAWSERGRAPRWIAAAKNRDKYLVDTGYGRGEAAACQGDEGCRQFRSRPAAGDVSGP